MSENEIQQQIDEAQEQHLQQWAESKGVWIPQAEELLHEFSTNRVQSQACLGYAEVKMKIYNFRRKS